MVNNNRANTKGGVSNDNKGKKTSKKKIRVVCQQTNNLKHRKQEKKKWICHVPEH